jgi:DNA-binding MarR family transcriptional regulator
METPREGLSLSELRTWRRFTKGVFSLLNVLDRQLRADAGISFDDFGILRPLWASPEGSVRMSELAESLSFSPSRLSHAVQRLEDKGWVVRERASDDGRSKLVRLTPTGQHVFRDAWPGHSHLIRTLLLDQLDGPSRAVITDALTRVDSAARQHLDG